MGTPHVKTVTEGKISQGRDTLSVVAFRLSVLVVTLPAMGVGDKGHRKPNKTLSITTQSTLEDNVATHSGLDGLGWLLNDRRGKLPAWRTRWGLSRLRASEHSFFPPATVSHSNHLDQEDHVAP